MSGFIQSPDDPGLIQLVEALANEAVSDVWPAAQLARIAGAGFYHWFVPRELGGLGWSSVDIVRGYVELSSACLTSTFILTQRVAALRRICASPNIEKRDELLPGLISGESPATVGISHLTTSRRHLGKAVLGASPQENGFLVNGFSPWVTGAAGAKWILLGAELADGQQILFVVESSQTGVTVEDGFDLVALSGSQTGAVKCDKVFVKPDCVMFGPTENVLAATGTATGSFQTSSLAIGLSKSAIEFLKSESENRDEITAKYQALSAQFNELESKLLSLASGVPACTNEELRAEANSLVLRATQAALVAAKGSGFVAGHRVGRWCREALFFLVWSCPQTVLHANLCELAGIES